MNSSFIKYGWFALVIPFGCAGGTEVGNRAVSAPVSSNEEPAHEESLVEDIGTSSTGETARQEQPAVVEKTPEQVLSEQQDLLDTKQRESEAKDELARYGAVETYFHGFVITFSNRVLFLSGQATLLPSSELLMSKVATALLVTKERNLSIEGHTDTSGTAEGNVVLSRQRAETIRTYLIAQGYPAELIRATGIGQDHPVSTNESARGRVKNERMEITVSY